MEAKTEPSWEQRDIASKLDWLREQIGKLQKVDERLHQSVQQEAHERTKAEQAEAVAREREDKAMAERFQTVTWSGLRPQIGAGFLILAGLALNIWATW